MELSINHEIIHQAATCTFGNDVYSDRYKISQIIKRNSGKIHTQLQKVDADLKKSIEFSEITLDVTLNEINIPTTVRNIYDFKTKVLIPKRSIKVFPAKLMNNINHCRYSYLLGTFDVSEEEHCSMFSKNKLLVNKDLYYFYLKEKVKSVNNVCIYNFKNCYISKLKNTVPFYGYCALENCNNFKIVYVISQPIGVNVFSTSFNCSHGCALTGRVKGVEREILGERLLNCNPTKVRLEDIKSTTSQPICAKNLGKIKSDSVLRKIKSEAISKIDRSVDDFNYLILMRRENLNYVKYVGEPLIVFIFSEEQLNFIRKIKKLILKIYLSYI